MGDTIEIQGEEWQYQDGEYWQSNRKSIRERSEYLYENREMSDVGILACDENWWFGKTVQDFYGHKFILGSASPVLHRLLYEMEFPENSTEIVLNLDPRLNVSLSLQKTYSSERLEINGVPPIAAEALLEYLYKDKFEKADYENGYSRNLLWRLWHASKALEINHLSQATSEAIDETMCEDTVFWDLNYSMQYKELGTGPIMVKVLQMMEGLEDKLFKHPNFVWIEHPGLIEILNKRRPGSCEPLLILNNLLRWSLYQLDRTACCEVNEQTGSDIPIEVRIDWIKECREGKYSNLELADLEKYLNRGMKFMPWNEMSQKDFLKYVVPNGLIDDETLLKRSIELMEIVVHNPIRLELSSYGYSNNLRNSLKANNFIHSSPKIDRKSNNISENLSEKNSPLQKRKVINDISILDTNDGSNISV